MWVRAALHPGLGHPFLPQHRLSQQLGLAAPEVVLSLLRGRASASQALIQCGGRLGEAVGMGPGDKCGNSLFIHQSFWVLARSSPASHSVA